MRILVADSFPAGHTERLRSLGHDVAYEPALTTTTLPERVAGHDVLVVRSTKVSGDAIRRADGLALIVRAGAGVNTIDVEAAAERGVVVSNTPGRNAVAVAELAMGLILAIDRNIPDNVADLRQGTWNKKRWSAAPGLAGKRLGIVGFGAIGREVAVRAHAFDMQIVLVDRAGRLPEVVELIDDLGCMLVPDLETLAETCDIISFHVPAASETTHLLDASLLDYVRPGAVIINTSRADVVDEDALLAAIETKGLRVGTDVFAAEPGSGAGTIDSALALHPSVYGTHHIGASTAQSQAAIADEVVAVINAFGRGMLRNAVNLTPEPVGESVITVRHYNRVGVLARVLGLLRKAGLNVEQMSNTIFAGGQAANAAINLSENPAEELLAAIAALDDVMGVSTGSLTGPRPSMRPFDGYLPRPDIAHRVTAPPLSSITVERYERMVANYPRSILRVMRSAIDTITGGREHSAEDEKGAQILASLVDEGALQPAGRDAFYVYRYASGGQFYTGLLLEVATSGLDDGTIRPHEATRTETEELVLDHFRSVRAHSDPVAMMYRADEPLRELIADVTESVVPRLDFDSSDGAHHLLWVVDDEDRVDAISSRLAAVDRLYVTDGHHRAAASQRYAAEQAARNPEHTGSEPYNYLTTMLFADDEVGLEGYHRCLTELGDLGPVELLEAIRRDMTVEEVALRWANEARPRRRGQVAMLLEGAWYRITFPELAGDTDVYEALDAVRLQRHILGPLLGVADPETDPRLEYIPGPAGLGEFARRGVAVGFALHRPATSAIMAVADAGRIMPPKSTWFEPKIRAGLVVRRF